MRNVAGLDASEMRERSHEADGAVPAHAEIADVVEENHAGLAGRIRRIAEQRADDGVRSARLVDDRGAEAIEVLRKRARRSGMLPTPRSGPPLNTSRVGSPPV